jgi:two-component system, NtrC family, sensor kinase
MDFDPQDREPKAPDPGVPLPEPHHSVLLIEDERTIRVALKRFFGRMGWEVAEAADGKHALELLLQRGVAPAREAANPAEPVEPAARQFDMVLSDVRMPGLNGVQLYERLKAERPDVLPKLVFATGDVTGTETVELLRTFGCPVVYKPFRLSLLQELADRLTREAP